MYNSTKPTSTKCKADKQGESHVTKKFKTVHNSNRDTIKQKNEKESNMVPFT